MKQVVQSAKTGVLSLQDVPEPVVKRGHLLVMTTASLISAGTERMMVDFARKSLVAKARARPDLVKKVVSKVQRDGIMATLEAVRARLDEPLPLGYSAAGRVLGVGAGLEGQFSVGDRVAIAGAGIANHAEKNVVPANLAVRIPGDVKDEEACFGTLAAIALNSIRLLEPRLGDFVAVIGAGLVGQLAAQLLSLHGCRVICLDYDSKRLALAKSLGAELTYDLSLGSAGEAIGSYTGGLGCDGILIAAATKSSEPFETAAAIARDRARVALVGITGTEFPYREFMKKELSIHVSRSYGPGRYDDDYEKRNVKYPPGWVRWTETENLLECVRLMGLGRRMRLNVGELITHRFEFAAAEEAYALVTAASEPHLGVVLAYRNDVREERRVVVYPSPHATLARDGQCVLGVVGAGTFAKTKLLPIFRKNPKVTLHTVVTDRGLSANDSGHKFGFRNSSSDLSSVFDSPEINAILVATPHSTHSELTVRGLAAGKSVFVEKPLALSRGELRSVVEERNRSAGFFQVGFNRRFAPAVLEARRHLARLVGVKTVMLRINAGQLAAESWQRDRDQGGGRILGELCHFVDLARSLVGCRIVAVHATAARLNQNICEDVTATLNFEDGSLATVFYTTLGDSAYSKERFECYASGGVIVIDNFRTLDVAVGGRVRRQKMRFGQDKGHRNEIDAFVSAVASGGEPPVSEAELTETSLATIAVLESLRGGTAIAL